MQVRYFHTAWQDIRHSPGWFGRLCLLALLCFVPIFGVLVLYAYAFGWAREIAWGTHKPMPSKIICNDDGRFWRRGWFVLLLCFIFQLIPLILNIVAGALETNEVVWTMFGPQVVANPSLVVLRNVLQLVALVLGVLLGLLALIGSMRVAIYDKLSAGFQMGKIVRMFRHDASGMGRILGMGLLVGLVVAVILVVVGVILIMPVIFAIVGSIAGFDASYLQYYAAVQPVALLLNILATAGPVALLMLVIYLYVANLASVFMTMLVVRAMGYWTMGFDVALWGGQDDPLPFELASNPNAGGQGYIPLPNTPAQQKMREGMGARPPMGQPVEPPGHMPPGQAPAPSSSPSNQPYVQPDNRE